MPTQGVHDTRPADQETFQRVGTRFQEARRSVDDGDDVLFSVDHHGNQVVHAEIHDPHTAFGDLQVAELTPLIQLTFPYSVNPRQVTSLTDGSGAASVTSSLLKVSTGTTTSSDSLLQSVSKGKHHAGHGTLARFDAIFDSGGTAGTEAVIGLGNEEDGFFFGYDGAVFGLLHRHDGKLEHRTLTFTTGAVTAGGTITITLDGDATEVEVVNGDSVQAVARAVAAVTFTKWEVLAIGDAVVFTAHHAEAKSGTFSLVDTDTTGVVATAGLIQSITGVAPTDTWVAQTAWNEDTMDGGADSENPSNMNLVVSNGNVYEIKFQYGFGSVEFAVEDPDEGEFVHVHTIQFANTSTTPVVQNPTLPMYAAVSNGATTTDITIQTSMMSCFTEGQIDPIGQGLANSTAATLAGDLTTETIVFTLINKPIFQGVENRVNILSNRIAISGNGAGAAKFTTIRVRLNTIIGGNPSFVDVSTPTSVASVDTAGTTISGGNLIASFNFSADFNAIIDLLGFSRELPPESTLSLTAEIDGGTSDIDASLNWDELF